MAELQNIIAAAAADPRYKLRVCSAALRQEKKRARWRPFSAMAIRKSWSPRDPFHLSRDRSWIFWIEQQTAAVEHLGQAGSFGGKHWQSGSHGFDKLQPEALVARGMDQRYRTLINRRQIIVGDRVGTKNSLRKAKGCNSVLRPP